MKCSSGVAWNTLKSHSCCQLCLNVFVVLLCRPPHGTQRFREELPTSQHFSETVWASPSLRHTLFLDNILISELNCLSCSLLKKLFAKMISISQLVATTISIKSWKSVTKMSKVGHGLTSDFTGRQTQSSVELTHLSARFYFLLTLQPFDLRTRPIALFDHFNKTFTTWFLSGHWYN